LPLLLLSLLLLSLLLLTLRVWRLQRVEQECLRVLLLLLLRVVMMRGPAHAKGGAQQK